MLNFQGILYKITVLHSSVMPKKYFVFLVLSHDDVGHNISPVLETEFSSCCNIVPILSSFFIISSISFLVIFCNMKIVFIIVVLE